MIVAGEVLAIPRADVDTDQIIPARYLSGLDDRGYGAHALEGMPGGPALLGTKPDATILVFGPNAGCGSSREHAAWALRERGFRAIVAPSFARIFEENLCTNGIVPVRIAQEDLEFYAAARRATIDVERETIALDDGPARPFALDPVRKHFVLGGGMMPFLLSRLDAIRAWDAEHRP